MLRAFSMAIRSREAPLTTAGPELAGTSTRPARDAPERTTMASRQKIRRIPETVQTTPPEQESAVKNISPFGHWRIRGNCRGWPFAVLRLATGSKVY